MTVSVKWRLLPDFNRPSAGKWGAAHAAVQGVEAQDVRLGSFPLVCGAWAPDAFDAELMRTSEVTCKRCLRKLREERRERCPE